MAMQIKAARLLTYEAATLVDQGQARAAKEAAMAKLYASEMVVEVTNQALQVFGGQGYMKECPAERHYRDARAATLMEGTSDIQRIIIARELIRGY